MEKNSRGQSKRSVEEKDKNKLVQHKGSKRKRTKVSWKTFVFSLLGFIILTFALLGGFLGYIFFQTYTVDETKLQMKVASTLYDRHGQEVTKLFRENREYIYIEDIPKELQEAFIAVEDQRFYDHRGVDLRAIARALYRDILARSKVEGGSTITQQLVKNVFLSHEKKWLRKTEEAVIAIKLEQSYSKDQILEMYLNYIYLGHGTYGIAAAADLYFDKEVPELNLAEMAMLAALPKAPYHYSPKVEGNDERSENRRKLILRLMEEQGRITPEQRQLAAEQTLVISNKGDTQQPELYTFLDMVAQEAETKYGITYEELITGGYNIYTTLDLKAQRAMYEALHKDSALAAELFPAQAGEHMIQGSMVVMDHRTGGIVAVMGGRDYVQRGLNRAVIPARQPGSTFKPIAAYAAALELGWHPYDMVRDEQQNFNGYQPRNYNNQYLGNVPMIDAIKHSYNVPAVWTLNEIGIDRGVSIVERFGFNKPKRQLGIALGGDVEVSPLQMARAYGAFASEGVMMQPYLIEVIQDGKGNVVAKNELKFEQAVSAQTAWYMTRMLQSVVKEGTARHHIRLSHEVAAKTGTVQANNNQSGAKDAWIVGYTPQYVGAVWMGYEQGSASMSTSGGNHPARIFQHVMSKLLEGEAARSFQRPEGVKELEPPVRFEAIEDLHAFLRLKRNLKLAVDLDFSPQQDDRVGYRIYRINPETEERQLLAELQRKDLVNGRGWTDEDVGLRNLYSYQVVPFNIQTGQEGPGSNIAKVQLFDRGGSMDDDELEEWLRELEGEQEDDKEDKDKKDKKDKKPDNPDGEDGTSEDEEEPDDSADDHQDDEEDNN